MVKRREDEVNQHGLERFAERTIASPVGTLRIQASSAGIVGLSFAGSVIACARGYQLHDQANTWLDRLEQQLNEYFKGSLHYFDLPLAPSGTEFQQQVWQALCAIPYGETCSYRDLAEHVNRPRGFQAVGQANSRNRIAIVIPCHRVVQHDGGLGGYAGGSERKKWLLAHELKVHKKMRNEQKQDEQPKTKFNIPFSNHIKWVR